MWMWERPWSEDESVRRKEKINLEKLQAQHLSSRSRTLLVFEAWATSESGRIIHQEAGEGILHVSERLWVTGRVLVPHAGQVRSNNPHTQTLEQRKVAGP